MSKHFEEYPKVTLEKETADEIHRLKVAAHAAQKALRDRKDAALWECPVRIDDEVKVNGYSHEGKTMRVGSIAMVETIDGYMFKAKGKILKKDGSEGTNVGDYMMEIANAKT